MSIMMLDYEKLKNEMDSSRNSVEEILIKYNKLLDDMPLKIKCTLYIYNLLNKVHTIKNMTPKGDY